MKWQLVRAFLARRLSREAYLGLHLTLGLLLILCLVVLFAVIADSVEDRDRLVRLDNRLGLRLERDRLARPVARQTFLAVTWLGSVPAMTGLPLFGAVVLLMAGRRLLALVWLFASAGGGILDTVLKVLFERPRPAFRDPAINTTTLSFPSGHSMGAVVGYGFLAYVLVLALPRAWQRVLAVAVLGLLIVAIGFSRVYLGAHYLSDVLGGLTVGGCWLAVCILGVEVVRRRPGRTMTPPSDLSCEVGESPGG